MTSAWVVACALSLLGRSAASMPPIELLDVAPIEASPGAEAFVRPAGRTIYLITSSPAFQDALRVRPPCVELREIQKIASILVHEEWHVLHGPDESGAYRAQLQRLIQFGVPVDNPLYISVVRSMNKALKKRLPKPGMLLAGQPSASSVTPPRGEATASVVQRNDPAALATRNDRADHGTR